MEGLSSIGERKMLTQFRNCRLLVNHNIIRDDLWIRGGKIMNPRDLFWVEKCSADVQIDCNDAIISPGFIDLQINGGFGIDFSMAVSNANDGVQKVAKGILAHGVTSFCPTLVTSPSDVYHKVLPQIKRRNGSVDGAGVLGVHVEGPFINSSKKGAHPQKYIRECTGGFKDILDVYGSLENIAIATVAPELPGVHGAIKELCRHNVVVSLGHSTANMSEGEVGIDCGATFITHLFNAMQPFHHRDPGLVGLLASDAVLHGGKLFYGMIADGIHSNRAALRLARRVHPDGLILVTDAMSAMGLAEGKHKIGQETVEIYDNSVFLKGTDVLAGSIATMDSSVQHFYQSTACGKVEALEAATLHPAQLLGITDHKGTLDYFTDADFVLLDDDLNVQATYIAGELVWEDNMAPERKVTRR